MPLYEFVCLSCQTDFEFLVRGREWKKEVHCPSCGQSKPDRLSKVPSRAGGIRVNSSSLSCSGNPSSCGRCGG